MQKAKAVLFFSLWLIPALVAAAIYIVVADRVCHVEPTSKQGQDYKEPGGKYADVNGYRYQREASPLTVALVVVQAAPEEDRGDTQPKGQEAKSESWIKKFFCEAKALDVALVLFTYCLVIVTGWLVYATVGLREETATLAVFAKQQAEDMKDSVAAAKDSAKAAKAAADEMIAERRPFIGIVEEDFKITKPLLFEQNRATITFEVVLRNVGKSVATNVTTHLGPGLQINPIVAEGVPFSPGALNEGLKRFGNFTVDYLRNFSELGIMMLPGATKTIEVKTETARANFKQRQDGKTNVWVPFCVGYKDDAGRLHGTGYILQFIREDAAADFPPVNPTNGAIRVFGMGSSAF